MSAPGPQRVTVLTGATSGIGEVTARELARDGGRILLVCRNAEKADRVAAGIRTLTGNEAVETVLADLAVQKDVRRAAAEILGRTERIDCLVNNAGLVNLSYQETVDGFETTFAVNHLAPFLLTNLLLDRIRSTPAARIVTVSSEAHRFGRIRLDDPNHRDRYRWTRVYGQSKLANILFTRELASRLAGTGVTANCLHPGAVATGLGVNNGWIGKAAMTILGPFMRTPEQGAQTSIHLARSPEVATTSGRYFASCREKTPSRDARDDDVARRLWQHSEKWTGQA